MGSGARATLSGMFTFAAKIWRCAASWLWAAEEDAITAYNATLGCRSNEELDAIG